MQIKIFLLSLAVFAGGLPAAPTEENFEKNVRPLLVERCGACHNPDVKTAGLDLTTPAGLLEGDSQMGLLRREDRGRSRLLAVVRYQEKVKMPPMGPLDRDEVDKLSAWIEQGAPLPETTGTAAGATAGEDWSGRESHWSFQAITDPTLPEVRQQDRVRNEIDRFVLAKLEDAGLQAPPDADKLTLLRRATFDLHGLPPASEEITNFLADNAPGAYERLIERLLASPRYGERWGRHWLDVARYAETGGIDENTPYREAWRYREYVIDAFNRDTPYDRFMLEQIAGDLLPPEDGGEVNVRGVVATGFLALGPKAIVEQDKMKQLYDVIDEQIDTVSKSFLGLTIACARCHDHKFDPITARDYYAMASILRSTRQYEVLEGRSSQLYMAPLVPSAEYEVYRQRQDEISAIQREVEALIEPEVTAYVYRELHPRLVDYMVASWELEHKQAAVDDLVRDRKLEKRILESLAGYLKPDGSFRPYLEKWRNTDEANVRAVAEEYAEMIREPAERWRGIQEGWAREVLAARREGRKPPPEVRFEGFAFSKESERFFGELSFLSNTFNERNHPDGAFAIPEKERKNYLSPETRARAEQLETEIEMLKKTAPSRPLMAHGVAEGEIVAQAVLVRGNHSNLGEPVAKRFPAVLAGEDQPPIHSGSGRLELGRWLGSPANPLPARVAVNRIWLGHFGEGLVRTPDNFGLRGEAPTHPELLDFLARRFIQDGWSIKQMHRLMMTSSAYRFSSETSDAAWQKDPDNRLWSRFERRRLSIEEMRDSWLAVDGSLDLRMGGILDAIAEPQGGRRQGPAGMDLNSRRTIYLPVDRNRPITALTLYDFVDSTTSTGQRNESYIAPQALYLMNDKFFDERAAAFAKLLLGRPGVSDEQRIEEAALRAWGRRPSVDEMADLRGYLDSYPAAEPAKDSESAKAERAKAESSKDRGALDAWVSLCRLVLASSNFLYVD